MIGLDIQHRYAQEISEIKSKHVVKIDLLDISSGMELRSKMAGDQANGGRRITIFPPHDTRTELAWYIYITLSTVDVNNSIYYHIFYTNI